MLDCGISLYKTMLDDLIKCLPVQEMAPYFHWYLWMEGRANIASKIDASGYVQWSAVL